MARSSNSRSKSKSGSRSRSPGKQRYEQPKVQPDANQEPKLYVNGLSADVQEYDLRETFEKHGEITDIKVVNKDNFSFAFITFGDIRAATEALNSLNNQDFKGKTIRVNFAKPRAPRDGGFGGGRGGFNGGGDRPRGCFKCGEEGHMSRECPNPGQGGNSRGGYGDRQGGDRPRGCFKCGEEGHMSRECTNPSQGGGNRGRETGSYGDRSGPRKCFKCQQQGHMSRECPNESQSGRGSYNSSYRQNDRPEGNRRYDYDSSKNTDRRRNRSRSNSPKKDRNNRKRSVSRSRS